MVPFHSPRLIQNMLTCLSITLKYVTPEILNLNRLSPASFDPYQISALWHSLSESPLYHLPAPNDYFVFHFQMILRPSKL